MEIKYKGSTASVPGSEWLGTWPSHWSAAPLWTLYQRQKSTGHPEEQLLSVYRDRGVIPKASRDDNFNRASEDLDGYQLVVPGDLVVNKMKAWQGSVAVSTYRGIVSPAYFVHRPLHKAQDAYLHHLMRCHRYVTGYFSISKGIRVNQWDLDAYRHSRLPILLPPLIEQQEIVTTIESETDSINKELAQVGETRESSLSRLMSLRMQNRFEGVPEETGTAAIQQLINLSTDRIDLLENYKRGLIADLATGRIAP